MISENKHTNILERLFVKCRMIWERARHPQSIANMNFVLHHPNNRTEMVIYLVNPASLDTFYDEICY
jgi:hypothetical protein